MAETEALEEIAETVQQARADELRGSRIAHGELTLDVTRAGLRPLVGYMAENAALRFTTLIDITGVDHPGRERRFDVVYHFLSMEQNQRVRLKLMAGEDETVPSITDLHPSANWFEREVFDMFGVMFAGHPDLRRILTDYGFRGHPLRKDFPTTGYVELWYDETEKRVAYRPVELVQEYRAFDFLSPWEGAQYVLPGDEKNPEVAKRQAE